MVLDMAEMVFNEWSHSLTKKNTVKCNVEKKSCFLFAHLTQNIHHFHSVEPYSSNVVRVVSCIV